MREPDTCVATVVGTNDTASHGIFEFEAVVTILQGEALNIWVGENHYVIDPEGDIQRGQFVLLKAPDSGAIARIVEPNATDAPDEDHAVKVEREVRWDRSGVDTEPTVEHWSRTDLEEGDPDATVTPWDSSTVVRYIRPTSL